MLPSYLPILLFIIFGAFFSLCLLGLGRIMSPHNPYSQKLETYECGFAPFGDARFPFDMRYYRIAILFIIFDVETAFLFPWAVTLRPLGLPALLAILPFLSILLIGFIYEWKKGVLEWV